MNDAATPALKAAAWTGVGVSRALKHASYDKPSGECRTLVLALFEAEWRSASSPALAVVTRIHHRSGVYGLVAPRGVGSNFATLGVRYYH